MADYSNDAAKKKRIQTLVAQARARKGNMPPLKVVIPKEALPAKATEDQYNQLLASVVLYGTHSWYIGRLDLPPETKVDWDGVQCRDRWIEYTGRLSHPDLEKILADVNSCMSAAGGAAIAAGLLTGNFASAVAAFKASLIGCLEVKGISWAHEIGIWIDQDQKSGDWHYCF